MDPMNQNNMRVNPASQNTTSHDNESARAPQTDLRLDEFYRDLCPTFKEWVDVQGEDSRSVSITMAHDAQRLADAAKDVFDLDRITDEINPVIDSRGGYTTQGYSGASFAVVRHLAEQLLPQAKELTDDEWSALSAQDKVEFVRQSVRLSGGQDGFRRFRPKDFSFIADNIETPRFQILSRRDSIRFNTIFQFARAAIQLLKENSDPVFFEFNGEMIKVERNRVSDETPSVDEVVAAYLSR